MFAQCLSYGTGTVDVTTRKARLALLLLPVEAPCPGWAEGVVPRCPLDSSAAWSSWYKSLLLWLILVLWLSLFVSTCPPCRWQWQLERGPEGTYHFSTLLVGETGSFVSPSFLLICVWVSWGELVEPGSDVFWVPLCTHSLKIRQWMKQQQFHPSGPCVIVGVKQVITNTYTI